MTWFSTDNIILTILILINIIDLKYVCPNLPVQEVPLRHPKITIGFSFFHIKVRKTVDFILFICLSILLVKLNFHFVSNYSFIDFIINFFNIKTVTGLGVIASIISILSLFASNKNMSIKKLFSLSVIPIILNFLMNFLKLVNSLSTQ